MAHISQISFTVRSQISQEIQSVIDLADAQGVSPDFIAGLETALSIVNGDSDSKPTPKDTP